MHFAYPLPWWLLSLLVAVAAAFALFEYRRPVVPLLPGRRGVLGALRGLVVLTLLLFLFRPMVLMTPTGAGDAIVPVVVDVSRSMRVADADGQARIARAATVLETQLLPALSRRFKPVVYGAGEALAPADVNHLAATARRTDLAGALAGIRDQYRGQRVAGVVLLTDGGDTSGALGNGGDDKGLPVFAIGIGSPDALQDREVLGITAGDPRLDEASVDLHVTAVSYGFGRTPYQLRVLENGRLVESRRIVPVADGSPTEEVFTVAPDLRNPTVYTTEIALERTEAVVENNARSVLVNPAGRKRRLLMVEGAPGFEHSFMQRALARDTGLEVDSVVRKGKNSEGQDTFFVQAGSGRTAPLLGGFPSRREDLFGYDAVVIANTEGDVFSRAQLANMSDFVSERGGGLLVLGGRSFWRRGLLGTPIEDALPIELNDRRGDVARAAAVARDAAAHNKLTLTPEGEAHPIMRVGASVDETRRMWAAAPPLAATASLGGPRPGATVLAVTSSPAGGAFPLVAVQRFGEGRSMVFAGEASWRWKMMMPSTDRTHELFWRQTARWLAGASPDPVTLTVRDDAEPGDGVEVTVRTRDAAFAPVTDADVSATLTLPDGQAQPIVFRRVDRSPESHAAVVRVDQAGLYKVHAEARRGTSPLGSADRWFDVGGADREFADPRLNEALLRRVARTTGGRYVRAADAARVGSWLEEAVPQDAAPERRDLWHEPWAFALVVALLAGEWIMRRRWGLR